MNHTWMLVAVGVSVSMRIAAGVRERLKVATPRRAVRNLPRTRIADAREGARVRLVATVADGDAMLTAPLTGRRCAYFLVHVDLSTVPNRPAWTAPQYGRITEPLVLTDGTGRALLDLNETEIDVAASVRIGHLDGGARFREYALEVGAEIAVVGHGVREPDPDAVADVTGYREGPPTRLRLGGTQAAPCFLTDDDRALESR